MSRVHSDPYSYLVGRMIAFFAIKDRTVYEVRSKLHQILKAKFPEIIGSDSQVLIDKVLSYLQDLKLLDDTVYLSKYLDSLKNSNKPIGPAFVRKKLLQKGISMELLGDILPKFMDEDVQFEKVSYLAQKKVKLIKPPHVKEKLYRFLMGKGFDSAIVSRVVDSIRLVD